MQCGTIKHWTIKIFALSSGTHSAKRVPKTGLLGSFDSWIAYIHELHDKHYSFDLSTRSSKHHL